MNRSAINIERLATPVRDDDLHTLAGLLVDAVESGAAVSFLSGLQITTAADWWAQTIASAHERSIHLVARESGRIIGTVRAQLAWAPNQPHRAEVSKLLVSREHRCRGIGAALVEHVEHEAKKTGFTLLTLDARRGEDAERLYRRLGWVQAGTIPGFAFDPDGATLHDAVLFYKKL